MLFLPTKGQVFQAKTVRMLSTFEITKKDRKIDFNRLKQVYPERHGSCFAGGLDLAAALCLFKLLFHCRFDVFNFRAADIKFSRFLSSFSFQCFESGAKGEYLPQSFRRVRADFSFFFFLTKKLQRKNVSHTVVKMF